MNISRILNLLSNASDLLLNACEILRIQISPQNETFELSGFVAKLETDALQMFHRPFFCYDLSVHRNAAEHL